MSCFAKHDGHRLVHSCFFGNGASLKFNQCDIFASTKWGFLAEQGENDEAAN
jgi:hypothetical protein